MLKRRKESDIHLATVRSHRWSLLVAMKEDEMCSQHFGLHLLKRKSLVGVALFSSF